MVHIKKVLKKKKEISSLPITLHKYYPVNLYYYYHFPPYLIGEESKAQRDEMTCLFAL